MQIEVTPKQLVEELKVCLDARKVPYVTSSPGVGKSSLVKQIADEGGLKLIDLRLSQCTPEDLQGFPMREGNKATFTPFSIFPLAGEERPPMLDEDGQPIYKGDMVDGVKQPKRMNGWLLLLDELSSANKAVQAAAYKVILDRQVGSFDLHEDVYMVACGNKITDKAVVHKMSTALQSRMIHYSLKTTVKEWSEWAIRKGFDYRILGYIQFQNNKLMDFNPDHNDRTYPCPRTWDFLNDLIKDQPLHETKSLPRVAGTIGSGTAVEFLSFCQVQKDIPSWSDLTDPNKGKSLPIPHEASAKYATISMISSRITEAEVGKVLTYIQRFTPDFQIIFCRGVIARFPDIDRSNAEFNKYSMKMIVDLQRN